MAELKLDPLSSWVDSFPGDEVEQEIADLLEEIERLKGQVRRRREVLKMWRGLRGDAVAPGKVDAARRHIASTRTKGRDR